MMKIILLSALAVFPFVAIAQEAAPDTPTKPLTRIEVNEADHKISLVINGKTMAVLEESGLKVSGDIQSETYLHGVTNLDRPDEAPTE